jgi:hypothetical protein
MNGIIIYIKRKHIREDIQIDANFIPYFSRKSN